MKYFLLVCFILISGCQDNASVVGPYPSEGLASWYNYELTASAENYGQYTCAMRAREFGGYYLVCNIDNNKCVKVRHNDFGPARRLFNRGRIIDLSRHSFLKIANLEKGLIRVRIGEVRSGEIE